MIRPSVLTDVGPPAGEAGDRRHINRPDGASRPPIVGCGQPCSAAARRLISLLTNSPSLSSGRLVFAELSRSRRVAYGLIRPFVRAPNSQVQGIRSRKA